MQHPLQPSIGFPPNTTLSNLFQIGSSGTMNFDELIDRNFIIVHLQEQ